MDTGSKLELYAPLCEFVANRPRIRHRPRETVELWHHQRVAAPYRRERLIQTGTGPVGPGEALVGIDAIGPDAELDQRLLLSGEILLVSGAAGVTDQRVRHGRLCNVKGSLNAKDIVPSM